MRSAKDRIIEELARAGASDQWVNGTTLITQEIGGQEALRRVRELREAGAPVEMRRHPDPRFNTRQYRLEKVFSEDLLFFAGTSGAISE